MCLFASFMLLITAWTGAAHAAELAGCNEPIAAEMIMHVAGDCEQVPADSDKAYPHHHDGCHGQHIGMAALGEGIAEPLPAELSYAASRVPAIRPHNTDRTLRPPRA